MFLLRFLLYVWFLFHFRSKLFILSRVRGHKKTYIQIYPITNPREKKPIHTTMLEQIKNSRKAWRIWKICTVVYVLRIWIDIRSAVQMHQDSPWLNNYSQSCYATITLQLRVMECVPAVLRHIKPCIGKISGVLHRGVILIKFPHRWSRNGMCQADTPAHECPCNAYLREAVHFMGIQGFIWLVEMNVINPSLGTFFIWEAARGMQDVQSRTKSEHE